MGAQLAAIGPSLEQQGEQLHHEPGANNFAKERKSKRRRGRQVYHYPADQVFPYYSSLQVSTENKICVSIRECIKARSGASRSKLLIAADYNQVEVRLL